MDFFTRIMPPARFRLLCVAMMVLAIVLCIMSHGTQNPTFQTAAITDLALAVGGIFAFWRCPRCRCVLPLKNMMYIKKCSHCRADIQSFHVK
ncbi:MAG: hypothetical protein J6J04_01650 [Oscillospiraceae bacterium]|nr:hypothetical protein [Oscillospiraceae bacterium]